MRVLNSYKRDNGTAVFKQRQTDKKESKKIVQVGTFLFNEKKENYPHLSDIEKILDDYSVIKIYANKSKILVNILI